MKGYWVKNGDGRFTSEEVAESLMTGEGIAVLDGPSGCGKTSTVKSIGSERVKRVPADEIFDGLLEHFERKRTVKEFAERFRGWEAVCFEDADVILRGKEATQEFFAEMVKHTSGFTKVIITGISLAETAPVTARLIGDLADVYTFFEKE